MIYYQYANDNKLYNRSIIKLKCKNVHILYVEKISFYSFPDEVCVNIFIFYMVMASFFILFYYHFLGLIHQKDRMNNLRFFKILYAIFHHFVYSIFYKEKCRGFADFNFFKHIFVVFCQADY